jgi:hypothetical protein
MTISTRLRAEHESATRNPCRAEIRLGLSITCAEADTAPQEQT